MSWNVQLQQYSNSNRHQNLSQGFTSFAASSSPANEHHLSTTQQQRSKLNRLQSIKCINRTSHVQTLTATCMHALPAAQTTQSRPTSQDYIIHPSIPECLPIAVKLHSPDSRRLQLYLPPLHLNATTTTANLPSLHPTATSTSANLPTQSTTRHSRTTITTANHSTCLDTSTNH